MRVLSDLHIDNGSGGFKQNAAKLHLFLDDCGSERLLFNGDTLDFWKFDWFEILGGPYRQLLDRLAAREDIILPGNHDIEVPWLRAVFPKAEILPMLKVGNREIFHGFQVDPLLDSSLERWLVSIFDHLMTDVEALNALRDKLANTFRTNDPLISVLLKMGKGRRYLLGHSHVAEDLGWFVNSGSLLGPDFPWVKLEDSGDCTLHYFQP